MTIKTDDLLNSILESLSRIDYIHSGEIPNIDLYMDQVTTFMEKQLESTKRYPQDKILTKTMINNYAKNDLLPPPVKKKYSKEHVLILIFIYYFKNILSIRDIDLLLKPLTEKYFGKDADFDLSSVYEEVCQMEKNRVQSVQDDITALWAQASESYADAPEEDREMLQLFAFICSLSFDVYIKKQIIEKVIDSFPTSRH
ncbi:MULTISPECIES: DUF1836 domain-containing protein [Sellimonas]|uniref:DUF1836 domain-containing protein n=1 Tax=Sellimonas caecigallum TaxID=2592333 RepID=A0ABS7L3X2_9FIRM|nr:MULTISPECIES: DUF1836 domain-containing protein [Sellimonas]MBY0757733.1 DUF1836 domain-containing protein [Sellimonas caecigallum]